jgi:hypothetical protein
MRTLGNSIDTSFVDLKGGTTGQILSKASNTDLDYTWIANDQGDITGVTAGTGITGGGTSGAVTVSFDQANFGGGQFAAAKNKIINGDMGIWQRGTSTTTNTSLLADRFYGFWDGSGTFTYSQQTFTLGAAPVAGYEGQYFARIASTSSGTSTFAQLFQRIEDVRCFAGQTVTFSFWAKADSARTFTTFMEQIFGSGGSSTVLANSTNFSVTTSWQRFTTSFSVPSISGKTIGTNSHLQATIRSASVSSSFNMDIWGVQLEAGSTATPFQTATGTKQGELAACQRYYWRTTGVEAYGRVAGQGIAASTTSVLFAPALPVSMRTYPSSVDYSTLCIYDGVTITAISSLTLQSGAGSLNTTSINAAVTGATAFRPYFLAANNSTSGYIGFSAEL